MLFRIATTVALLAVLLPAPAAVKVTEVTVPLAEDKATRFYFQGDIALAVAWDGDKQVEGRMQAFDLARATALWQQRLRVQESEKSTGGFIMGAPAQGQFWFGNGPLTLVDAASGRILWALDCKVVGSVDVKEIAVQSDGTALVPGTDGCGNYEKRVLLRVELATGKVRWRAVGEVLRYKDGDTEKSDFSVALQRAPDGAIQSLVLIGKQVSGIDWATGAPRWTARPEPGRDLGVTYPNHRVFVKDSKITLVDLATGAPAWSYDAKTNFPSVFLADSASPTSDLIVISRQAIQRVSFATGQAAWVVKRQDETWGESYLPPLVVAAMQGKSWAALDAATGTERWRVKLEDGRVTLTDRNLSPAQTGMVLLVGYDTRISGPYTLTAVDAASGTVRWKLRKIGNNEIVRYAVVGGHRLLAFTGDAYEIDLATGTPRRTASADADDALSNPLLRASGLVAGPARGEADGIRLSYALARKELSASREDGPALWTRKGEEAEGVRATIVGGAAIFAQKNGTVEVLDLATGAVLATVKGNDKPALGIDRAGGRVLVPQGKTLHILTISN